MKRFLLLTLLVISSLLYAEDWTGTGWALKKGYIVTNFHCVDGAKSIVVETSESHYSAKVVATDPSSDLAIIKIDDNKFRGFGEIPYSIERKQCEVGETVWTLGFPMTSIMVFLTIAIAIGCSKTIVNSIEGGAHLTRDLGARTANLLHLFSILLAVAFIASTLLAKNA
jgi:hypothetical protein